MKVLITGSTGFVGTNLCNILKENSLIEIQRVIRDISKKEVDSDLVMTEITKESLRKNSLEQIDTIIHLASYVHKNENHVNYEESESFKVNFQATKTLIDQAIKCKVRRFIFLSSVGVYGDQSFKPFNISDNKHPNTFYARSKLDAENYLISSCKNRFMDFVILRSPLIYGKNPRGNLHDLKRLINLQLPLPFLRSTNKRSLIDINVLVKIIVKSITEKRVSNGIFNVGDKNDYSTKEIINLIAKINNQNIKFFYFPAILIKLLLIIFGKKNIIKKLFGDFQIESTEIDKILNIH